MLLELRAELAADTPWASKVGMGNGVWRNNFVVLDNLSTWWCHGGEFRCLHMQGHIVAEQQLQAPASIPQQISAAQSSATQDQQSTGADRLCAKQLDWELWLGLMGCTNRGFAPQIQPAACASAASPTVSRTCKDEAELVVVTSAEGLQLQVQSASIEYVRSRLQCR